TRHGVWTYDINQPVPDARPYADKPRLYPNYSSITYATNGAGHQYHSLAAEVRRQFRNGLSYQAHYTLARDIGDLDDGQAAENAYNRGRERAVWPDIPTHRFLLTGLYELPFGKSKPLFGNTGRIVNGIIGGLGAWRHLRVAIRDLSDTVLERSRPHRHPLHRFTHPGPGHHPT